MRDIDFGRIPAFYEETLGEQIPTVEQMLRRVPVYDLDELIDNYDPDKMTLIAEGDGSKVLKLDQVVQGKIVTLKVMTHLNDYFAYFDFNEDEAYWEKEDAYSIYSGKRSLEVARDITLAPDGGDGTELALSQIWGHALGTLLRPDLIDPPVGVWVARPNTTDEYRVVGYSLPFIEGEAITVNSDPDLIKAADELQENGIYVGNRSQSKNAMINPKTGIKKFIDAELRLKRDPRNIPIIHEA